MLNIRKTIKQMPYEDEFKEEEDYQHELVRMNTMTKERNSMNTYRNFQKMVQIKNRQQFYINFLSSELNPLVKMLERVIFIRT